MMPLSNDVWMNVLVPLSGCLPSASQVFADVSPDQLVQSGYNTHPIVQKYADISHKRGRKFEGPLLVLTGEADQIVSVRQLSSLVNDTCNLPKQESLEFVTYRNTDHFPFIQANPAKGLPWVKNRLSGKVVSGAACVQSVIGGFRTDVTVEALSANFLVDWGSL
ncbi:hypothetical protein A1O7_07233 [Cladophialophora yegresii CBS 114405]|uniref:Peptidase S9 prolyl oligopeptidase catalytic domain-containing protein n=1 Tax=Cladophialophora yegresii CBS 114405 TaxID=1182544 RepID=W9WEE4_9EURO|nr:uncharacterized protein A1O7_07233 [Cladophialophora yegresii CBS 114405]EXJ56889.1 hypothetical protein A1O7_07233 [Cladophialophora yegresii CBS 114405]